MTPFGRLARGFQEALLIPVPLAFFDGCTLIVLFLALGEREAQFGAAATPIQTHGHERIALAFDGAD